MPFVAKILKYICISLMVLLCITIYSVGWATTPTCHAADHTVAHLLSCPHTPLIEPRWICGRTPPGSVIPGGPITVFRYAPTDRFRLLSFLTLTLTVGLLLFSAPGGTTSLLSLHVMSLHLVVWRSTPSPPLPNNSNITVGCNIIATWIFVQLLPSSACVHYWGNVAVGWNQKKM